MPLLSPAILEDLSIRALVTHGATPSDAKIMTTHLMHNQMCGKASHGLVRVKWITDGLKKKGPALGPPLPALDLPSLAIIDGQNNIGLVACEKATQIAIEKARTQGIAFAGARNYHTTSGSMHCYNKMVLDAGMIGIMGANSVALVSHPQGHDPVLGTNPLSFAIPSKEKGFLHDVTTSEVSYGSILLRKKSGLPMQNGWMIDANGNPSTDPKDAYDGAMLPLSGFKGFGIGLAIELLAGPLIGAKGGRSAVPGSDGFFAIVINPALLGDAEKILADMEAVIQEIKSSRRAPETEEILIPGERSLKNYAQNKAADLLDIPDEIYNDLLALAGEKNA